MSADDLNDATAGDAWGQALADHLNGRPVGQLHLEVDDGNVGPAMPPEWFFRSEPNWEPEERHLVRLVKAGPVLDLGYLDSGLTWGFARSARVHHGSCGWV